ncbi:MAG: hypothetical protein NZ553_17090 [Caldilinea sp.]|nr:hypothetical protein [Caldilinea sp.]MDW8442197.1 hypothetical protein [Caldilineaceae bacterium]
MAAEGIDLKPFVRFSPPQTTEGESEDETTQQERFFENESALAGHIRKAWERNKVARARITQRLLKCLRARRGVYSANEIAQLQERGTMNIVWVDLTEEKCKAAAAWIREVLVPVGDYPFDTEPTPVPDLPQAVKMSILEKAAARVAQSMAEAAAAGEQPPTLEQFRQRAQQEWERMVKAVQSEMENKAREAARRMRKLIADAMAEGGWDEAMDAFIEDFVTYPAAVLHGPVFKRVRQLSWSQFGAVQPHEKLVQSWEWIDIFDVYPDPNARDCQTGDFIVRRRYTRADLFNCIGLEDYDERAIRMALDDYAEGHLEGWIWQEAERRRLQAESLYSFLSPRGTIDALHYFGSVPGWKLMSWRPDKALEIDEQAEYEVEAILIGPYVIRCTINNDPLRRRPFFNASFDRVPGSFWGRSIPDLCETSQKMVNAAACALADNMSWASGPQAWVHVDRLADGENAIEFAPLKVWQLKSDQTQGVNPGVGFFQANSNAAELMALIEKWSVRADDATGVPRYTYGNERVGGAASTYSGLAMLMNNAAKGLRRAIAHVDAMVIRPSVHMAFVNEMLYGQDMSAKADVQIVPRGATTILIREARNQALLQAAQLTANPVDMQIIGEKGRAEMLRRVLGDALEIDWRGIVPDDAQIEEAARAKAEQMAAIEREKMEIEKAAKLGYVEVENRRIDMQAAIERERIASDERMKGAEIAAKRALALQKANRQLAFEYDSNGNVVAAKPVPMGDVVSDSGG